MLINLNISNYALIKELNFAPSGNMNTITGETGAGKSILLGALGLLLGKRADTKVLMDEERKCVVEGTFNISSYHLETFFKEQDLDYEQECIIRREIAPSGKSRAFINDTPTTLDVLKEIGTNLMDIHSQHDNLMIGGKEFQRFILDAFAEHETLISNYQTLFKTYKKAERHFKSLQARKATDAEELDYKTARYRELKDANLDEEEFRSLESDMKIAENAQEIKSSLLTIAQAGTDSEYSALSSLDDIAGELKKLSAYSEEYEELLSRLDSSVLELKDILSELERKDQSIEFDEGQVQYLQERFDLINGLLFKHKAEDIPELEAIRDELESEINLVANLDEELADAEKALKSAEANVLDAGRKLSDSRKKAGPALEKEIVHLLEDLGMPNAIVQASVSPSAPGPNGTDEVEILFSANKGFAPQSIKKAASGGEMSRLLFAIKYILAAKTSLPTIVFDEIDTGVSGEISLRMGNMMQKMAKHHQVITITHLPQVAAKADRHFFVFKLDAGDTTHSDIRVLEGETRVTEIAKMLSGDNPTEAAYQNAKELLYLAD